ncbi:MAG: hypothetical protein WBC85_10580 [Planktotalea sp.]|uniref:hypothetical protein n=1 Tax=Planktotalea sp. TaxID=2029877 RepID=UPI003C71E76B
MSFITTLKTRLTGPQTSKRSNGSAASRAAPAKLEHPNLDELLVIPVSKEPHEERLRSYYFNKGQFLSRQERWEDLTQIVIDEDKHRNASGGGMPVAELLCQGARSDVVALAEHLLIDGAPEENRPLSEAISALENILGEHSDNHVIATIVAMAHLDIAWAWRGTSSIRDTPARNLEAFDLHCTRARQVLDPFCGIELDSPLVTSARCALLVGNPKAMDRVADDYEDLIDLAPTQQRHIRALGHHMLPQWFGDYQKLELEARRTAARTQDIWGAGAYTWAFFDALLVDPKCANTLDMPFFLEGIRDILERSEDQHNANLFASYTAVSIPKVAHLCDDDMQARSALEQIQKAAQWIMSEHLHELHPLVWGHAMEGFDNQARIASIDALFKQGREKANQVFMGVFGEQMRKGNALIFTPQGLYVQQA